MKLPSHYTSINDMPILNWSELQKGGSMELMLKKGGLINEEQTGELKKIWRSIQDQYFKKFGFPPEFMLMMQKKMQIAKLKLKRIITRDESIGNFIRKAERELANSLNAPHGDMDIYQLKIVIEKYMSIRLPLKEVTVIEFYSYLADMKKNIKRSVK